MIFKNKRRFESTFELDLDAKDELETLKNNLDKVCSRYGYERDLGLSNWLAKYIENVYIAIDVESDPENDSDLGVACQTGLLDDDGIIREYYDEWVSISDVYDLEEIEESVKFLLSWVKSKLKSKHILSSSELKRVFESKKTRISNRFNESEFNLELDDKFEFETIPHDDVIELGGYTWTKVGKIDDHDLYLCNDIVKKMAFSESDSNDWYKSDIRRWLNTTFYNKLADFEKDNIIKHPETGDNIFLLSIEEAEKVPRIIRKTGVGWWLRTCGYNTSHAAEVNFFDGEVSYDGIYVLNSRIGVRPALLLK